MARAPVMMALRLAGAVAVLAIFGGVPTAAHAQSTAPGTSTGWCTVIAPGTTQCFGTPLAACDKQHQVYGGPGAFYGASDTDKWWVKGCSWQWVFGWSQPSIVNISCNGSPLYGMHYPGICLYYTDDPVNADAHKCGVNGGGTPNPVTDHPINLVTGKKFFEATDFETRDESLILHRNYSSFLGNGSSSNSMAPPLGLANWTFDFQYELQFATTDWNGSNKLTMMTPQGAALTFDRRSDGSMVADSSQVQTDYTLKFVGAWPSDLTTLRNSSTQWTMQDSDDTVWTLRTLLNPATGHYDIARPTQIVRRTGLQWTLAYGSHGELSSITDSLGKVISFDWLLDDETVGGGAILPRAISAAHLPGGQTVKYTYDTIATTGATDPQPDRLSKVQYVDSSSVVQDQTSYQYGNATFPYAVTGVVDKNGIVRWTAAYDSSGRASNSSGPGGADSTSVTYSSPGSFTRTVTNALGKQAIYSLVSTANTVELTGVNGQASTHCPASASAYTYGTDTFVASSTDQEGRVTTFTHDARGMPAQIVEGSGTSSARTTTITWHPTLRVPTRIVQPGLTTDYVYDTQGRPTSKTLTDTTAFTTPYATNGRTRTWHYTWGSAGQLLTVQGPAGTVDTVTNTYNTSGYLQTTANQLGQTYTVTAWDWRGSPLTVVNPNAVTTTFTYDFQGRPLTATIDPSGTPIQYQFSYTATGDVARVTLPTGAYLQYTYDNARRITQIADNRGDTQAFTYDAADDPLTATVKNPSATITNKWSGAYDELARTIQAIGASAQTWNLSYDKVSNLTQVNDPLSHARQTAFDPLNRVITKTDPQSNTVRRAYDGQDNLKSLTDGRSLQTTRVVDGFGEVIQEISPDRGTRSYWYDVDGDLTKLIDGDSEETDFTYDHAHRRTAMTFPAASVENVTYTYDQTTGGNFGVGHLTGVTEESGSTALRYDKEARVVADAKVIQGRGYNVAYTYDANSKLTQITYPSGRIVTVTRATDGLITGVTTKLNSGSSAQNVATGVTYAPFGPLTGLTYGNGLALARTYDQDYHLTRIQVTATGVTALDLGFQYYSDGRMGEVDDNAATGRTTYISYTNAGQLNYAAGPWGQEAYSYDAAYNRTGDYLTVGSTTTTKNEITWGAANRLANIQDQNSVVTRSFGWTLGGDLSSDQSVGGPAYVYYYNSRKRLVWVTQNGATAGTYGYDYLDQRVWRSTTGTGAIQSHYVFDRKGHLLAEHNASTGAVLKEYIWVDDLPVAVVDSTGSSPAVYYIHTGQMDEPLELTDSTKALAWNSYVNPWGWAKTFSTASESIDLRLPGQWYELETNSLSQNHHRNYNPSIGRYIQADPLGIDAGQNVYAYAGDDPLDLRDPKGLWQLTLQGGDGVGARITIGNNHGQWSLGAYVGIFVGGSVSLDTTNADCKPWGSNPGLEGSGDIGLGPDVEGEFHAFGRQPFANFNAAFPLTGSKKSVGTVGGSFGTEGVSTPNGTAGASAGVGAGTTVFF